MTELLAVSREMERANFAERFAVSRETMALFDRYVALLDDWQERMNLVGKTTLPEVWSRHFADSAQLVGLSGPGQWLDIGAGAGFPGLVAALLGAGPIDLVESTAKKARFLETVAAELALTGVTVHSDRVEAMPAFPVATITARACAPLVKLFEWGSRFAREDTTWLLLKGSSVEHELAEARHSFAFHVKQVASITDPRGRIVVATDVRRRR